MACPRFVGRIDATRGVDGPYPNEDASEILWRVGAKTIYRYAYPPDGSSEIEWFDVDDDGDGLMQIALAPAASGYELWWVTATSGLHARDVATSAGTDTSFGQVNPGGNFSKIVYSNHDGNLYVVTWEPDELRIYRVTTAGSITLHDTITPGTFNGPPTVRSAGNSLWMNGSGQTSDREVWRYRLTDDDFAQVDAADEPLVVSETLATTHDGRAIFHRPASVSDPTLAAASNTGTVTDLDCPELYDGAEPVLQGGAEVPGNPGMAVMSHYVDYVGEPDGDWIWEWPGRRAGRYVGKVGRGGPRA